jgi:tRNA dimethylallyltransferase
VRALEVTLGSGMPFSSFGPGLMSYTSTAVAQVGIPYVRSVHDELIELRFYALLESGLLDEVRTLVNAQDGMSRTARQAIGYKELISHLEGAVSFEEATRMAILRSRNLARRQWSWFRRDPRIFWLDPSADLAGQLLERWDAAGAASARSVVGD